MFSWHACLAPFKSAVKNVVKKEKIVGGLLASTKPKKGGKNEKNGKEKKCICKKIKVSCFVTCGPLYTALFSSKKLN